MKNLGDVAIDVHDLTVAYDRKTVLWNVDVQIPKGKLIVVIGPNGAGKSTFLKAILGLVPFTTGTIDILGKPLSEMRNQLGYVPQRETVDWDFPINVFDAVLMGRYGKLGWFRRPIAKDREIALEAIEKVGLTEFKNRQISELSGGQQQRIFIARALAQESEMYFMDEPFAGVDASTEKAIVKVLKELKNTGKTVVVVHHDLQTIKEYFDHIVMLNLRLTAQGPVKDVFNADNLEKTYSSRLVILDEVSEAMRTGSVDKL